MAPPSQAAERQRIVAVLISLVAERGYEAIGEEELLAAADINAAAFRRHFAGKQDCFDRAWGEMANDFIARLRATYAGTDPWRDRLRASAYYILRYFQADEARTRFFMLGVLEAGPLAAARRDLVMQVGIDIVDGGRQELADADSVGRDTADAVVVSIYQAILAELQKGGGAGALTGLVPKLMQRAVYPYLGPVAAAEELAIGPPPPEPLTPRR